MGQLENIQKTIKLTQEFAPTLKSLCKPLLCNFGITFFDYIHLNNEGHATILNSNPGWLSHYFDNQFYRHDPRLVHPNQLEDGYGTWQSYRNHSFQGGVLADAQYMFNLSQATSFIQKDDSGCHIFSIATHGQNTMLQNHLLNHQSILSTYFKIFPQVAKEMLQECHASKINIESLKADNFHSQQGLVHDTLSDLKRSEFLACLAPSADI